MSISEYHATGRGTLEGGDPFEYDIRFLRPDDVDRIMPLHRRVIESLPQPLLLYERPPAFFENCTTDRGCVVGALHGDRVIAYAALYRPCAGEENYGRDLDLPPDELPFVGHLAGSAVDPDYRGNGLQRKLVELRTDFAREAGVRHMCGEVLPQNIISIANHLAKGFFLKADKIDKVGLICYVLDMRLDVERPAVLEPVDVVEHSAHDFEACCEALRTGRWGYEVVRLSTDPHIRFGRFPAL